MLQKRAVAILSKLARRRMLQTWASSWRQHIEGVKQEKKRREEQRLAALRDCRIGPYQRPAFPQQPVSSPQAPQVSSSGILLAHSVCHLAHDLTTSALL